MIQEDALVHMLECGLQILITKQENAIKHHILTTDVQLMLKICEYHDMNWNHV